MTVYLKSEFDVEHVGAHDVQVEERLHRLVDRVLLDLDEVVAHALHLLLEHERLLLEHLDVAQYARKVLHSRLTRVVYRVVDLLYEHLQLGD